MLYVFDIDMTLADNTERANKYLVDPPRKDYDGYYEDVSEDLPIYPMLTLMKTVWEAGHDVQLWTSRRETCWGGTRDWLNKHCSYLEGNFSFMESHWKEPRYRSDIGVKMRPFPEEEPRIKDFELKERWLMLRRPDIVFDDRLRCVDMYRSHGVLTCQPQPDGGF